MEQRVSHPSILHYNVKMVLQVSILISKCDICMYMADVQSPFMS